MAYVRDLWMTKVKLPDGGSKRVKGPRYGKGKRWQAVWEGPDGREVTMSFDRKVDAEQKAAGMVTDIDRGDYIDPRAGKVLFGDIACRWLGSRLVDPATKICYESIYRLHVSPAFAQRQVKSILPSQVQTWISDLSDRFAATTVQTAFLVLQGVLDLAVADEAIRKSPAKASIIQVPKRVVGDVEVWTDEQVLAVIDAHPAMFSAIPVVGAACGLRAAELFGLALEDIDFDEERIRVRRQIKKLGKSFAYALPKNDRERLVPLPAWAAQAIKAHVEAYRPITCTLPWEKLSGPARTHNLLFRWTDDSFIKYRSYSELIWKPALAKAGIIPKPVLDDGKRRRYTTTRKEGPHQLRHYYASVVLSGGVSVRELAEFLGHQDPAFTLRVYAHMQPGSYDLAKKIIDNRLFHPRAVPAKRAVEAVGM